VQLHLHRLHYAHAMLFMPGCRASHQRFTDTVHGLHLLAANNAYIFPAVGHAAVLCGSKAISDDVFLVAAECLSHMTSTAEMERGFLFPRFNTIKEVSARLAAAAADFMCGSGLGELPADFDAVLARAGQAGAPTSLARWQVYVRTHMFNPQEPKL
jgi:malic enzyme